MMSMSTVRGTAEQPNHKFQSISAMENASKQTFFGQCRNWRLKKGATGSAAQRQLEAQRKRAVAFIFGLQK
jgi:hypothetical protein